MFTVLELCAGGGGQAVGLEAAGFRSIGLLEIDRDACETLRQNRPDWNVIETDIRGFDGGGLRGVDLVAAGAPCPPFSIAGRQLGAQDERDLIPQVLRLVKRIQPRAVMLENVKGLAGSRFADYRRSLIESLHRMGFSGEWKVINASDFGVPQLRPRFVLVGFREEQTHPFEWPTESNGAMTVGQALLPQMRSRGWTGAETWKQRANGIAPTIVGGSKKHGGPDLGPTRAKAEWRRLAVDANGIADLAPTDDFPPDGVPRLTVPMVARLQGFPTEWEFAGRKTSAYRQVGNAFPPPVAKSVGVAIRDYLVGHKPVGRRQSRLVEKKAAFAAG